MKRLFLVLGFFLFTPACYATKQSDVFVVQHKLSSSVTFDFTKSLSEKIGTISFLNKENKTKKWRYIVHTPRFCLYNRKTKKCNWHTGLSVYNPDPDKLDSIFFAFLDSSTYHFPVEPYSFTQVDVFIDMNAIISSQVNKNIRTLIKDYKDLEYHVFIRTGDKSQDNNKKLKTKEPDFIIKINQVIPCKHADYCK